MTISAQILADSITEHGVRLTTLQLRYPRFIHAEELTHRQLHTQPELIEVATPDGVMYDRNLSRNASSSRAIPVHRLIDDVLRDPAMPIHWGKNQAGMQAREELTGTELFLVKEAWIAARDSAVDHARFMIARGAHKQIVNRLLEPFSHINVVVTATEWDNFFQLRLHPDAQPEIHELASQMKAAMDASTPRELADGEWHLPYGGDDPMVSAARCARVSYLTHDGRETTVEEDGALAQRLLEARHMSPFEHQARPGPNRHWHSGNLRGWRQYRQEL